MKKKTEGTRTVFIPKEYKHDDSLFVAVNGERLLVRKGEPVTLPVRFAEVIENSAQASKRAERYIASVTDGGFTV